MTIRLYRPHDPQFALPGSERHGAMITASKAAAICGVSRWSSAYSCWLTMKGLIDPEPPKDVFDAGHAAELMLAELWRLRHPGWRISRTAVQYQSDEWSYPAAVTPDRVASRGKWRKLVELKTTRDWEEWGDVSREGDCPTDYAVQCIFQQAISGEHRPSDLMVLGPWLGERYYTVEWDDAIWRWIDVCCREFWDSLDADEAPELDDSVSTYRAVRQLHPDIAPGLKTEIPEKLAWEYGRLQIDAKQTEKELRGVKSEILATVASAQFVTCNGDVIAARQPHRKTGIALVSKGVFGEGGE